MMIRGTRILDSLKDLEAIKNLVDIFKSTSNPDAKSKDMLYRLQVLGLIDPDTSPRNLILLYLHSEGFEEGRSYSVAIGTSKVNIILL